MADTNFELPLIDSTTDLNNIYIGESLFSDDVWDLGAFNTEKAKLKNNNKLRFAYITNENMKRIVKLYAYHKLGEIKPQSIRNYINGALPKFIEYCDLKGITSFSKVTKDDFLDFAEWMREKKKVTQRTVWSVAHVVKDIIKIGQVKGWDVPQIDIFEDLKRQDLWNTQKKKRRNKTKPIPEDILNKIIYHAVHDEKDLITKTVIIIQSQTGLGINEVLSIKKGCVNITSDRYDYMEVPFYKKEKDEPVMQKVFITKLVKDAIIELEKTAEILRKERESKYMFLLRHEGTRGLYTNAWNKNKLTAFIKRWDIRNSKGQLYPLKSYQFRATFIRDMILRKYSIITIPKQQSQPLIEMNTPYLDIQEKEVKEIYAELMFSPDSKIVGFRSPEINEILNDLFRNKTKEDIEQAVSDLSKSMSFKTLPTGVCLYDFGRGNCKDGDGCFIYDCPNYITEVRFHPILKNELDLVKKEMTRLKKLGQEPAWQVQAVKYKVLQPLVDSLEFQIVGKESI